MKHHATSSNNASYLSFLDEKKVKNFVYTSFSDLSVIFIKFYVNFYLFKNKNVDS